MKKRIVSFILAVCMIVSCVPVQAFAADDTAENTPVQSSTEERDNLVSVGWIFEGIGWFGMLR